MEWVKPELITLSEDDKNRMYDYLHEMALVDTLADIDDIYPEIVVIQDPQELSEIETCAAFCRNPCTQQRTTQRYSTAQPG